MSPENLASDRTLPNLLVQTIVNNWQWIQNYNPENFNMPNSFIPERWLGDARFASDKRDAFQPFSWGPRNCIGKK